MNLIAILLAIAFANQAFVINVTKCERTDSGFKLEAKSDKLNLKFHCVKNNHGHSEETCKPLPVGRTISVHRDDSGEFLLVGATYQEYLKSGIVFVIDSEETK